MKTIVFWGAGATASLGLPLTGEQAGFVGILVPKANRAGDGAIRNRAQTALGVRSKWSDALANLLEILGGDARYEADSYASVSSAQVDLMRRNVPAPVGDDQLRDRIVGLRVLYDWLALKEVIGVCPYEHADGHERPKLQDLFNILDLHVQSGHGFRARGGVFLTPQRVLGARTMLILLIQTLFYIKWHTTARTHPHLLHHYRFAEELTRRMQREGVAREGSHRHDERAFYMGDVSFVSTNWDPVGLWCQFVANRNLNKESAVPHVGIPAVKLRIFHDLAHFVAGPRVTMSVNKRRTPWQPMNESSARQLNDEDHGAAIRARTTKFLFPHGCLWWRECPNCGKLSSYDGDHWGFDSPSLLVPPPLSAFADLVGDFTPSTQDQADQERRAWRQGKADARSCVHCGTLTHAHHSALLMQSNFKSQPPPFVEEVQRDMRVVLEEAEHIVLMGYSLPPDDVAYRALFAARRRRAGQAQNDGGVRCSVVVGRDRAARWAGPDEWPHVVSTLRPDEQPRQVLETVSALLGQENVRFYGGGIPQVFLDGGEVTSAAVDRLLVWQH